ncbi:hypothetical protein [Mycobacterium sp.]
MKIVAQRTGALVKVIDANLATRCWLRLSADSLHVGADLVSGFQQS